MKEVCYQNVDPEKYSPKDPLRANSNFYNEGRWYNFIEPLLPNDCSSRTFLEIGCNAGMYLKMAKDKGFERVIGVEKNKRYVIQAKYYRKKIGYDYKIMRKRIGHWNSDYSSLPMADIVLFSCVHYHMRPIELVEFLDYLKLTAMNCIVVSVRDVKRTRVNRIGGSENEVWRYFRDWEGIETITIDGSGDPAPRPMYSVLFKNDLKKYRIKNLLYPQVYNKKLRAHKYKSAFIEFIDKVVKNDMVDIKKTRFYKEYIKIVAKKSLRVQWAKIERFKKLKHTIRDISKNGMKKPILVNKRGHILDGSHRIILLEYLGYEYVIGREI